MVNQNAVELDLSVEMRIHDVVNVSRLKLDRTSKERIYCTLPPPVRTSRSGTSYIIERIVNHRPATEDKNSFEYLVKWEGWPDTDNTWEPEYCLDGAKGMLNTYKKDHAMMKGTQRKRECRMRKCKKKRT